MYLVDIWNGAVAAALVHNHWDAVGVFRPYAGRAGLARLQVLLRVIGHRDLGSRRKGWRQRRKEGTRYW
jgi:hypothetical protein